jgi:hypothetical protein
MALSLANQLLARLEIEFWTSLARRESTGLVT